MSIASLIIPIDGVLFNSTGLAFVVIGILLLIRMAGFPDLTADGSFTIGAAVYSVCLTSGAGTVASLAAAAGTGALGGLMTWAINDRLGVGKVVSSVLSMIILVLSAPYVSGGSTRSLLRVKSFQATLDGLDATLSSQLLGLVPYQSHFIFSAFWLGVLAIVAYGVFAALSSRPGLRLRYVGSATEPTLVPVAERRFLLAAALMLGNALVAIGGAIEAQRRGGFTNNMGTGMLLVGLTVLILGESLIKSIRKRQFLRLREAFLAVFIGCALYAAGVQGLLALPVQIADVRLLTALLLLVLLGVAGRAHSSSARLF